MALKGLDELIKKIRDDGTMTTEAVTEELNKILPAEWVPKATFNEKVERLSEAEKAKKETDSLIKELQEKAGLSDEYKSQIENLKSQQAQAVKDFDAKIGKMRLDSAIEKALTGAKAKNAGQCAKLLDATKLQLSEDGSVIGLKEQVDSLKKDSAYLFEAEEKTPETNGTSQMPTFGSRTGVNPNPTAMDSLMGAFGISAKKD